VKRQIIRTSVAGKSVRMTFFVGAFDGARAPLISPSNDTHILGWFAKQAGLFYLNASIPFRSDEQSFKRKNLCRGVGIDDESDQVT